MKNDDDQKRFHEAIAGICPRVQQTLVNIPEKIKKEAQEIRLRAGRPVVIHTANAVCFITNDARVTDQNSSCQLIATKEDIEQSFQIICSYSIYSHQEEIRNGFVTIKGGHRVGICGTAVRQQETVNGIRDLSSLNIRIARQINGAAKELIEALNKGKSGTLLAGPPSCGKTTLLRDIARTFSIGRMGSVKKVAVVDERGEIGGVYQGVIQNDLGLCDILDGYPKGEGIMQAIRSLSPDIIICDEIGNLSDLESVEEGLNAGVSIIASIHAGTLEELFRRKQALRLLNTGAFARVVMLKDRKTPGCVEKIVEVGEQGAQGNRINYTHFNGGNGRSYGVS